MKALIKIQDKFFKTVFSRREIATELFQKTLPDSIQKTLDFEKIDLVPGSFVNAKLKEHFADLVYRCPIIGAGEVHIVLLLEHKSYQEEYPHFQLLQYLLELWNQNKKQKEKPVFILPIVFYHGKTTWHYQRMQDYFENIPHPFMRYLPTFDYDLIDLSQMEDHQIESFSNSFLAISTFLLKYRHLQNYIKAKEKQFVKLMRNVDIQQDEELVESIFLYVEGTNNLPQNELFYIFESISNSSKVKAMSTLERVLKNQKDETNYEAIKNLLKEGLVTDIEKLRSVLKVSKRKMEGFLKKMESE
ncbi:MULTISPECIES: Rpn family recombination-promoting nuclease/putative transposase [Emticicia]|uniref:Rpn family recombination-promoting nuclease/putative transposase n=1 Tax=Emticicia TaxID=312278 RepID=UPI0018D4244D|nr:MULTISPECIES: Rpn family recombination-promoting nuclease/putative transposase [Emticicia]